jgi:hypothetical protein
MTEEPTAWTNGFDGPRNGEFGSFHRVLTPEIIPRPNAPFWMEIADFALTFDGYSALGGFDELKALADLVFSQWDKTGELSGSLVDLRSCLFFEQRALRHNDLEPGDRQMEYIRALVDAIEVHAYRGRDAEDEVK